MAPRSASAGDKRRAIAPEPAPPPPAAPPPGAVPSPIHPPAGQPPARGGLVKFSGVKHSYRNGRSHVEAIGLVDLEVQPGEFLVVVGPSGCGKSTLLTLASGLEEPMQGHVEASGKKVVGPSASRILVFQQPTLFPWLSVRGNIEFGLSRSGVRRSERRRRSAAMLKLVQLDEFADSRTHQLSGGMRQRVALARALVLEPTLLLMDEPFAALDAQTREDLQDRLEALWLQNRPTVIFVTHDVNEAARLADRIVVMSHRPGVVRSEIPVPVARPRVIDDPALVDVARRTRAAMSEEVAWTRAHMWGWQP